MAACTITSHHLKEQPAPGRTGPFSQAEPGVHYDAIRRPQGPGAFIGAFQKRLREAPPRFGTALELGTTGGVDIVKKHGEPWIKILSLGKQE